MEHNLLNYVQARWIHKGDPGENRLKVISVAGCVIHIRERCTSWGDAWFVKTVHLVGMLGVHIVSLQNY